MRKVAFLVLPDATLTNSINDVSTPINGSGTDYDAIVARAEGARFVLLGEATHGTSKFYLERARATARLIDVLDVAGVVVEADGTEAERANRYVRSLGEDRTAAEALSTFKRFPSWMWRNVEFADFLEVLRGQNLRKP